MSEIKPGDLYEIHVKGKWNDDYTITESELTDLCIKNRYEFDASDAVHVEKIEPPVEVFKPGDVVRGKEDPSMVVALLEGGKYLYLSCAYRNLIGKTFSGAAFTSRDYERVDLS